MQTYNKPYPIERILAAATYATAGMMGFVWLILAAFMKRTCTKFLLYHIMQSIFISIAYFLVVELGKLLCIIVYRIPLINLIPYVLNIPIPFAFGFSVIQVFTTSVIVYLALTSFMGYYSYLRWVSNIIRNSIGR